MKTLKSLQQWMKTAREKSRAETRTELPFFWILTVVLVGIAAASVFQSPELQQPVRLVPFLGLMAVHLGLHWISPLISTSEKLVFPYLVLQGGLALIIALMSPVYMIGFGLYAALIGQAVGILRNNIRTTAAAVLMFLALSALSVAYNDGLRAVLTWSVISLPTTIFVVVYVVLYTRQSEARARAQNLLVELETANRQIEALTLAAERQRMARELHDTLAQGLAGLILQLDAADSHLEKGNTGRAQAIIAQAMERARSTLADSRRVIDDLRSSPTSFLDLQTAVREEVDRFTLSAGISCDLRVDLPQSVPEPAREYVLRFISECLTNIVRHAEAREARVALRVEGEELIAEVEDNGRGFDPETAVGRTGHYGLLGMQERARQAGGTLHVDSAPGKGARLALRLPLSMTRH